MKPILPKAAIRRRKLSVTLGHRHLQDVYELGAFLGSATDRAYIVEQILRRTIAEHKACQQWRSQKDQAGAQLVPAPESGDPPPRQSLRPLKLLLGVRTSAGHLWAAPHGTRRGGTSHLSRRGTALSVWARGLDFTSAAAVGHRNACGARETVALGPMRRECPGYTAGARPGKLTTLARPAPRRR